MLKHNTVLIRTLTLVLIILFVSFIFSTPVNAQVQYTPLAPISAEGFTMRTDLAGFIIDTFRLSIAVAAALAVLMIIIGGVQYMSTDAISGKKDGKKKIQDALLGLLLVMIAYLILYTVNPRLVDIGVLNNNNTIAPRSTPSGSNAPVMKWCAAVFRADTTLQKSPVFAAFDCTKSSRANCESQTLQWYVTSSSWCVAVFDKTTGKTVSKLTGFDCTKTGKSDCEKWAVPYYTNAWAGGNTATRYCVAVFDNTSDKGYGSFTSFDCTKPNWADCQNYAIPWYTTDNPNGNKSAKFCIALFDKNDGSFKGYDCAQGTMQRCKDWAIPNATKNNLVVKGTRKYADGTTHTYDGCFPKYTVDGTIKYPDGTQGTYGGCFRKYEVSGEVKLDDGQIGKYDGCFPKFVTTGEIPGVGQVGGCFNETKKTEFESKMKK